MQSAARRSGVGEVQQRSVHGRSLSAHSVIWEMICAARQEAKEMEDCAVLMATVCRHA